MVVMGPMVGCTKAGKRTGSQSSEKRCLKERLSGWMQAGSSLARCVCVCVCVCVAMSEFVNEKRASQCGRVGATLRIRVGRNSRNTGQGTKKVIPRWPFVKAVKHRSHLRSHHVLFLKQPPEDERVRVTLAFTFQKAWSPTSVQNYVLYIFGFVNWTVSWSVISTQPIKSGWKQNTDYQRGTSASLQVSVSDNLIWACLLLHRSILNGHEHQLTAKIAS